ncbi:polysaccharide biosynthesis/export family protein [Halopseudomonas xiamenensis]|uniref:polysaccharide biosynthesis/export family protein n=1 Tax=Halopseudomonas xiamenensis TaxID=157792 RepID=UPI001628E0C2|nr:polysaccharide biosynthesis/export family protein [Halopseudomonas xiamenensis]
MKRYIPLSFLMLALAGCASQDVQHMPVQVLTAPIEQAQLREVQPSAQVLRPQDVLDVIFHLNTSNDQPYRIQPGDHVELTFLTANELSGSRLVMPDGTIDVPYAGNIAIAGLTSADAHQRVIERYTKVLRRPEILFSIPRPMAQLENLRMTLNHPATGMSREITVTADGHASFPLIGNIALQGMTVNQLQETLNERYANEVGQIRADVMLKSTAPNQIYILGEVTQPGAYPVRRPVSVLEALTLAQGPNIGARLDSVVILRREGDDVEARIYDIDEVLSLDAPHIAYLQPDDLLYVPKNRLTKAGQLSRQLADVILFQGISFGFNYRVDNKENDN